MHLEAAASAVCMLNKRKKILAIYFNPVCSLRAKLKMESYSLSVTLPIKWDIDMI